VRLIRNDDAFKHFLQSVIVCTEQDYRISELERLAKMPHRLNYGDNYIELLSDIIKELLREQKMNKLQTFGYSLEQASASTSEISAQLLSGADSETVKCNYINLNK
jgi:hypothetical protein